ncbi:TetR/AcrR family transcriptional regulator [Actinomadura barringtoniae]|uniref:TetR/AcrR family transcriptional regulator n=1 Tax=Actinomadura barringtoniae TaxID=1427535 RepID=A0A939T5T7_9ACTN|nr:TetR/AcrR family transcriptional regulator [Actinomadura barringtoniae]MBO2447487.1 TetR/AcrR family transcriptional regulator [Actinomadura barringtoniae]
MATTARPLRRDAQRNRELLVTAAREIFGREGVDASLEEIARTAGVSIGTLYNRFPTRGALIEAAFLGTLEQVEAAGAKALEEPEAWDGFVYFVTQFGGLLSTDRGSVDVCTRALPDAPALGELKGRIGELIEAVIGRAKDAGALRADFVTEDLGLFARVANGSSPEEWRRQLGFLLDGLRA